MAELRLRISFDANVLIAGILQPRWPHEVMRSALTAIFDLVLPEQIITESRRHLSHPDQTNLFDWYLRAARYEEVPMPSVAAVRQRRDLVRSEKDVPIALALLASEVDIFVSNDKDFTESCATGADFQRRVRVMLPALFLREILNWDSQALEAIRFRTWRDLEGEIAQFLPPPPPMAPGLTAREQHCVRVAPSTLRRSTPLGSTPHSPAFFPCFDKLTMSGPARLPMRGEREKQRR